MFEKVKNGGISFKIEVLDETGRKTDYFNVMKSGFASVIRILDEKYGLGIFNKKELSWAK